MELLLEITAILFGIIGVLGAILPILPGPPISFAGMALLYFFVDGAKDDISQKALIFWLVMSIIVTIVDYIVPAYFTKATGGSKTASRASMVGLVLGIIFFPPFGMIIGAFLGALLAEMYLEKKDFNRSFKAAMGSFFGFLIGTGLKLITSAIMLYYIFKGVF